MIESRIVPDELRSRYETVSEALLDLSEEEISHLRLDAPLLCTRQRSIVPFEIVVTSEESDSFGIREHVINEIINSDESNLAEKLKGFFPPKGNWGFWDVDERIYRTRYMAKAVFGNPPVHKELIAKHNLRDTYSYWKKVNNGEIIPFMDTSIDWVSPDLENPYVFEFTYKDNPARQTISVGYRGCTQLYDYPFRASAFRNFTTREEAQPFERIKTFVSNLIVELIWCTNQITVRPNESESIIQHYKILPWTYMTDISYNVNIAKAFACSPEAEKRNKTPVLYKVVLLNVDAFNLGASFIDNLPFQRPKLQKALSLTGLNVLMQDFIGVIVSLTEHPFFYDYKGTSWDPFGGSTFTVSGKLFNSLFLKEEEYRALQSLLCPPEPNEIKTLFVTIIGKVRNSINRFGLSPSNKQAILDRLVDLEKELDIESKNSS